MLVGAVTVEKPRGGLSPDAYDAGWDSWNDRIRHSPPPCRRRRFEPLRKMTARHLIPTVAMGQLVALARAV